MVGRERSVGNSKELGRIDLASLGGWVETGRLGKRQYIFSGRKDVRFNRRSSTAVRFIIHDPHFMSWCSVFHYWLLAFFLF